jgi:hypothetical protein
MLTYLPTETATLRRRFYANDAPFDPNAVVSARVYDPSHVLQATLVPARVGLGEWQTTYVIPAGGSSRGMWTHSWRWQAGVGMSYRDDDDNFMVRTAPEVTALNRNGLTGTIHVEECEATVSVFGANQISNPPPTLVAGTRLGPGDVNLSLAGFVFSFLGATIPCPSQFGAYYRDQYGFSPVSTTLLPCLLDNTYPGFAFSNGRRILGGTKFEFRVSGIPNGVYYQVSYIQSGAITTTTFHTIGVHQVDVVPGEPVYLVGWIITLNAQIEQTFATLSEIATMQRILPVELQRIIVGTAARQMDVYFKAPIDPNVASYRCFYRNLTRNQTVWSYVDVSSSPVTITLLDPGCVYEVMLCARTGIGISSSPSATHDAYIPGM